MGRTRNVIFPSSKKKCLWCGYEGMDNDGALIFTDSSSIESGGGAGKSSSRLRFIWEKSRESKETTVEAAEEIGLKIGWGHGSPARS
jgi:hypothetical protein